MFRIVRPSERDREKLIEAARDAQPASPGLLTLANGVVGPLPRGFAHDFCRVKIGVGGRACEAAREALQRWQQFDLGWVRIANPTPRMIAGELVAVEACTAGLWSINFSRVVDVVDSATRFGFLYATTALHIEEGQERFLVEFDPERGTVHYVIDAVSRPRHVLARVGYPISRAMQHRFQRDSIARMRGFSVRS